MKSKKLQPLLLQDTIALLASAGIFSRENLEKQLMHLEDFPFQWWYSKDLFKETRYTRQKNLTYLAGCDDVRARELNHAFQDPKIKALLFVRGGYGTQRLFPYLKNIKPKLVMGSSDLTSLNLYLWKKFKMKSIYGPMVLPHFQDPTTQRRVVSALTDPRYFESQKVKGKKLVLQSGKNPSKESRLIGGCLSLITASLGTEWEIETKDSILFMEDVNEPPYKVDRMLTQLLQSGKLDEVKGFVLGTFKLRDDYFPREIFDVIYDRLKGLNQPILWGVPFGHHHQPLLIPVGGHGVIHGNELKILEGVYET